MTLRASVPMHQARWMAKAIYSLKIWLTVRESQGLRDLNIFITKIYIKFWFLAPVEWSEAPPATAIISWSWLQRGWSWQGSCGTCRNSWSCSPSLILMWVWQQNEPCWKRQWRQKVASRWNVLKYSFHQCSKRHLLILYWREAKPCLWPSVCQMDF